MAGIGDSIDPKDDILSRLSAGRPADELPRELLCPSGHRAYRQIYNIELTAPETDSVFHAVPVWICTQCVVGYRYNECTLPPGEEGLA